MIHWHWLVFIIVVIVLVISIIRNHINSDGRDIGVDIINMFLGIILIAFVLIWGGIFWW